MNVRNRRGIENLLLRRVRRHQSMTALFRAPGTDSGRPRSAQAQPLIQKQEQDSPVDVPMAEATPSLSVLPVRSDTVARKVIHPSTPKPLPPVPLTPSPSAPIASEPTKTPDPVWKRLQTIFRKHEEHSDSDTAATTHTEASTTESIQTPVQEEKEASPKIATEEHNLPTHSEGIAIPTARTVQRSFENVEPKSEPTVLDVQRKAQSLLPASPETKRPETINNVGPTPALPDKKTDPNAQASIASESEGPSLPLDSVWNVQRVEAQHPLFRENIPQPLVDSTDTDKNETSIETSPVHEQKRTIGPIQRQREDDSSTEAQISDSLPTVEQREEPREPVEILAPSRPRPPQTDLPSKSTSVQRQSQDHPASNEVSEAPPVNTAIGPLPADLWWLLGQKPPTAAQPEIQRTVEHSQKQVPSEQNNIAPLPAEQPAEAPIRPNTIQRQALSNAPLSSIQKESANSSMRTEETKPAEPDLDDLVRRVYAEVRRRLAAEWERRR